MVEAAVASPLTVSDSAAVLPFDFDTWMRQEQKRVFLLCVRILRDHDEADMAAQDSFLKAYRYLVKREAPGAETTASALCANEAIDDLSKWVTRVAVNTCLDRLRSRAWKFWPRRSSPEAEQRVMEITASAGPTAEDHLRAGEIGRRLATALDQLSPRQRAIFVLKHYEDRKLEEIGHILGLEVGTVKAHMARAVARLRTELADLYAEA
jgi:RNA polymerase sigma-70 factor, ECF subfamily